MKKHSDSMTTIAIAQRAGVSQATVSRVLNGNVGVAPEMIERVHKALRETGYRRRPRAAKASRPAARKQLLVAALVLSRDQFHTYASTSNLMIQGAADALNQKGYALVLGHGTNPDQLKTFLAKTDVEGMLLIGHHPMAETLESLGGVPKVWITSHHENSGDIAVAGNERVGQIAAEYLIGRGHQSIASLNTMVGYVSVEVRCSYFRMHALHRGVQVQAFQVTDTAPPAADQRLDYDLLEQRVSEAVDKYLAASSRPTGLFVPMDMQLAMVYRVLGKRGVAIGRGKDVELIGSDDEKAALIALNPRPATISIGPYAMGRRAAEQVLWRIGNPSIKERMRVMVEPELIPGEEP